MSNCFRLYPSSYYLQNFIADIAELLDEFMKSLPRIYHGFSTVATIFRAYYKHPQKQLFVYFDWLEIYMFQLPQGMVYIR